MAGVVGGAVERCLVHHTCYCEVGGPDRNLVVCPGGNVGEA